MAAIEVLDHHVIYDNPAPNIRSRHGYFPGLVKLPSGDLLALFVVGEALDATNCTTMIARSHDQGQSWQIEGPLHEKDPEYQFCSESMKPTLLSDGTLIATGYRFHRRSADEPISNAETDGLRDGDNLVSHSTNEGRTWTQPRVIPRTIPEVIEASGPSIELRDGTILAAGSLFPMWDGSHPSGYVGALLRSRDKGRRWDDQLRFFRDPSGCYCPAEPRLCELQEGRIVALFWMMDHHNRRNLPNHLTVSHDGGETWSEATDTGVWGQASNLMHWQDDILLTIHSQRERDVGLYVRVVDFMKDRWRTIEEKSVWDRAPASKVSAYATMGQDLKFGQPSLLRLDNGEVLATHWGIENGQSRILTHRLRIRL